MCSTRMYVTYAPIHIIIYEHIDIVMLAVFSIVFMGVLTRLAAFFTDDVRRGVSAV